MLSSTLPVLVLVLFAAGCYAAGPGMLRQDLPASTYPLAMCNDGTQANYYHQPGESHGKIYISLQGGGTCDSVENCDQRCANTDLCTAQTDQEVEMEQPYGEGHRAPPSLAAAVQAMGAIQVHCAVVE